MDTALTHKFPFILDRNLAKAIGTENHARTSCDTVVLGHIICLYLHLLQSVLRRFVKENSSIGAYRLPIPSLDAHRYFFDDPSYFKMEFWHCGR